MLPAFTCAIAICNLWGICLGLKILRPEGSETLPGATRADMLGILFPWIVLYLALDVIEELSLSNLITASS